MDPAGVALGALPLALYAVDNYRRCLKVARNYFRYESTLAEIQRNLFVQKRQLQVTLGTLNLENPTLQDTKQRLEFLYPDSAAQFMDVLAEMGLTTKLMDKLDIDMEGKPRWTDEHTERISWEWRKVKRSFKHTERQELFKELQHWNTALYHCLIRRPEVPSDQSDPLTTKLLRHFNAKLCADARDNARILHVILAETWKSHCKSHQHVSNLQLKWNFQGLGSGNEFTLVVPRDCGQQCSCEAWQQVSAEIIEQEFESATTQMLGQTILGSDPAEQNLVAGRPPLARVSFVVQGSRDPLRHNQPLKSRDAGSLANVGLICNLCSWMQESDRNGYLEHSESQRAKIVRLTKMTRTTSHRVPLKTALSVSPSFLRQRTSGSSNISRKDRLATAAAATWAVLLLCGTPWLEQNCLKKSDVEIHVGDPDDSGQWKSSIACFSHIFGSVPATVIPNQHEDDDDEYLSDHIRHKVLFSLGILLIELALNTPFQKLRQEAQQTHRPGQNPLQDDYAIANQVIENQTLEGEVAESYTSAVQRCLQCLFLGPDSTHNFSHATFRERFYSGVVAPVQATFDGEVTAFSFRS